MTEVHHFSYGLVTPVAAYLMSFVGSLLGLLCTARARATTGRSRASWLGLAALAIGGTGIWVMHFIAMLGFSIPNTEIRYDVPLTLLSCATAIVVVAIGLFIVGFAGDGVPAIVTGGVLTGIGVASMHYTGMTAMKMGGEIGYQPALVALSVVIALVAATAALWFALKVRGLLPTAGAALIMGVAVTGMHYTGMAAMRVTLHEHAHGAPSGGVEPTDFLLPLVGGVGAVATILLVIIAMAPSEDEMRVEAQLQERLAARRDRPQPSAPASPGGPTGSADAAGRGRTAGEWFGGGTPRP
ncbi:MHYT domain-containing protein, NO-binding membrane sensor [Actinomadura meyerae]|jgi:NO-binding membrane sensor protein with MHYT domain|uniref:MHYT domain-containing protein, NO-binding membrane sensor n=1 Tax=Actinomadura meyerae TaxID=240840 RepID=A0A239NFC6_9ACTN|nr:MHYT domain-containing protein [Actinomadura meyerae]SNT52829.1 MHYT domain-containing protein, NO-binding membrane sensor [Actinomadura meyerae]